MICGRQFCSNCARHVEFTTSSHGDITLAVCLNSCMRAIKKLQLEVQPWHRCTKSSKELLRLESKLTNDHTHLCSRLSNFEGLARFFSENADRVPRADILNTMPELEETVKQGISSLTALISEIQKLPCPPQSEHRDELVKKSLANFAALLLARIKAQFHISSTIYERLLHKRAFSPRQSPLSSPRLHPSKEAAFPSGEVDLDSL